MHQVAVAGAGDQRLGRCGFAPGVHGWSRLPHRLRFQDRILHLIVRARETEAALGPEAIHHREPLGGAGVARIVRIELDAVLLCLLGPPRGHDVQRQPAAGDMVNVRGLLREQCGRMESRTHGHHQLEPVGHRRQRRGSGPGVQRGRVRSLDVVEIELGDQREVETRPFTRAREPADVRPLRLHALVLDVAQPPAENRQPISEAHQRAPLCCSRKSTRRANGSNPTTRGASATKLDSALMS